MCMSRDPVTGAADTVVVNAAFGLGELVVSGLVTPDDYRLRRSDGVSAPLRARLQGHHARDGRRRPRAAAGARRAPREERVLDDDLLAELHRGLLDCERELGRPADCEFSVVEGRVVWLQCRPMTALEPPVAGLAPATVTPPQPIDQENTA